MNFFKSKDVHVFPSSFRGKYSERITVEGRSVDSRNPFDPESELNSEANLVAPGAIGNLFENYIVGYDTEENTEKLTRLRCVIGGYYFVIDNIGDYIYKNGEIYTRGFNIKDKFLCIKLRQANILSNNNESKTKILDSWDPEHANILDSNEEYTNSDFVGLAIFDNITEAAPDAFLKVIDADGKILNESLLPNIKHGTGSNSLSLCNSSQGASGNYSIAANECIASGNNSIAVGNHTVADKSDLTVVGKFNDASEDGDLFVVGCGNNSDDRQNALQVNASKAIINKPTTINSTENVTGDFSVADKFTVDSTSGNITVAGTTNLTNNLIVGGNKFTVDASNGNTSIDGTLSAKATTINGTESVSGDFSVNTNKFKVTATNGKTEIAGDLEVNSDKFKVESATGNTSVAGTLGVSGKTTINELEVTGQSKLKDITAVGTLTIKENSAEDNAEKFKVFASGQTAIYNDSDCKTESPALTVSGGVKIDKSLKVDDTIFASKLNICDDGVTINYNSETEKTQLFAKDNIEIGNDVDKGLKKLLLDLTYPVGSVYTYSGDEIKATERIWIGGSDQIGSVVENNDPKNKNQQTQPKCPIKSTLGGLWVQITGRFLLAAGKTSGTEKVYNINNAGGSKDMMLLNHKHDVGYTTVGVKVVNKELKGSFTTLRGNMGDATISGDTTGSIKTSVSDSSEEWDTNACTVVNRKKYRLSIEASHKHDLEISPHNHKITDPIIAKTEDQKFCTDDPKDKNMPPYLVVYMWKRVA